MLSNYIFEEEERCYGFPMDAIILVFVRNWARTLSYVIACYVRLNKASSLSLYYNTADMHRI